MTTNSPNPVDGDVQALIGLCKIEIKRWKAASETNPDMRYMVELMETALAALTAKPGLFEWRFKQTDTPASNWLTLPMEKLDRSKAVFGDLVEYRFWFESPPAQLLRPVELPGKVSCEGFNLKEVDEARGKGQCEGFNSAIDACREALRQQGYEVKND
ncbi:hypothetical protein GC087_07170 [Pantoea sp. JZ2]|uniref:hypothetical protein n=1 Tax=Pantoea sp. JZ2 TaxID=2654189 RepID=UPI002B47BF96|nr:hypothetical protein [Pantoea sp. JZ2]WRH12415.1 hypothetical protein GC087_07170 [Pantoea sp. JZ2]